MHVLTIACWFNGNPATNVSVAFEGRPKSDILKIAPDQNGRLDHQKMLR